jgi:HNH endonuclease
MAAQTLIESLLHASLLCALRPGGPPAHRYQLFYVAHHDLSVSNRTNDLQRALETGVDINQLWANAGERGSGEYVLTLAGQARAVERWGAVSPQYLPATREQCAFEMRASVAGKTVALRCDAGHFSALIDGSKKSNKNAASWIESETNEKLLNDPKNPGRDLYDYTCEKGWSAIWLGPIITHPTIDLEELERQVSRLMPIPLARPAGELRPRKVAAGPRVAYERRADVKAWVLREARARCERCRCGAPFVRIDGTPYLELHHALQLAEGGPDTVDNAVALCANCHRLLHHGEDRVQQLERLYEQVARLHRYELQGSGDT